MNDKVAEKIEDTQNQESELDQAFVKEEARVLDPSLLKKSLLDRMPTPSGWRILVLPYRGKGVTAYKETEKYGNTPWCKEKDWVLIGRYAGSRFRLEDDHEVRIINDDDVIGTILDPNDIKSL